MQMCVERVSFTQGRDDGQPWRLHTGSHEQDQTFMTGFPETIYSVCTRSVKLKLSKYRAKYVANGFEIQSNYRAKS